MNVFAHLYRNHEKGNPLPGVILNLFNIQNKAILGTGRHLTIACHMKKAYLLVIISSMYQP